MSMRALGGAVAADRAVHRVGRRRSRPAARRLERRRSASSEHRHDRGHRLGRLAVEAVRVALPHPDEAREPVVAELDDDRGDALGRRRGRSGRSGTGRAAPRRRTSCGRARRLTARATQGSASTALADRRPQPVRPEADRVVGRQAGLGRGRLDDPARLGVVRVERRVERDARRPSDGATSPATRSWSSMNAGSAAIGNDASGQVVEVVLGAGRACGP